MNTLGLTQHIDSQAQWPLYDVAQTRSIEAQAQAALPAYTLMQRAGLATAQLSLAIAPHAQKIWLAIQDCATVGCRDGLGEVLPEGALSSCQLGRFFT